MSNQATLSSQLKKTSTRFTHRRRSLTPYEKEVAHQNLAQRAIAKPLVYNDSVTRNLHYSRQDYCKRGRQAHDQSIDNSRVIDQYLNNQTHLDRFCNINLSLIKKSYKYKQVDHLLANILSHNIPLPIKVIASAINKYGQLNAFEKARSLFTQTPEDKKNAYTYSSIHRHR